MCAAIRRKYSEVIYLKINLKEFPKIKFLETRGLILGEFCQGFYKSYAEIHLNFMFLLMIYHTT